MIVGVPSETKTSEYRVGLTPESVHELVVRGHKVLVQSGAGGGIHVADSAYRAQGARIVRSAEQVFAAADLIVKVKEPLPAETGMLRAGQVLFTYFHLAASRTLTRALLRSGGVCIAYETVTAADGSLPLLAPMSQIAGRLAPQAAAQALQSNNGGCGKLLSGGGGVAPAKIVVIGAGVVGTNAALIAAGMGADVTVLDTSVAALDRIQARLGLTVKTAFANQSQIAASVRSADAVIGCVLVPGAAAPKLLSRRMLKAMSSGSVLVDVAIDQGGCFATSRATTHTRPTYVLDGIVHYCVANMPGAVPHSSTYALNNATLPYVLKLAKHGWKKALRTDAHLARGLAIADGRLACLQTGRSLKIKAVDPKTLLA